ncbi:hypothetical protein CRG98_018733 [Punica granatum]|uniref:Uncharacterized protein n=1 Tax=Punica granatum TaxID=22663 RepID=A0A2I0JYG7_PUNGR|nr:hypothetical protein CRG98_018733 [Punica granatum]
MKRRLCTVDRPSDRDHLFMRKGEGCEEPFEQDGMTRRDTKKSREDSRVSTRAASNRARTRVVTRKHSGIAVISVCHEHAPKAHREAFVATETSFGRPSRVLKGHLKFVPRPRWSLGACRPVSRCRSLVSGSGPPEPR